MTTHSVTQTVWLLKRRTRLTSGKIVLTWRLRWAGTGTTADGGPKYLSESLGRCTKAEAEAARRKKIADLSSGAAPVDRPDKITLAAFKDLYLDRRARGDDDRSAGQWHRQYPKIGPATITDHRMTLRYLVQHFGATRQVNSITPMDATDFLDALAGGKLDGARKKSKRVYTISEQTMRGHVRNAKTVLGWAATFGMIHQNPFAGFCGTPMPTDPKHDVTLAELDKLLQAAPDDGWRAMFALCRLAGLRRGEAQGLPWDGKAKDKRSITQRFGVDLFTRRLHVVAVKTSLYRVIPIVPALHELLVRTDRSRPTVTGLSPNNLVRDARKIAQAAGIEPWPDFFQSMRSSCENAWKVDGVAEATYAAFLGHDPSVSRKHYVSPIAAEYDALTLAG